MPTVYRSTEDAEESRYAKEQAFVRAYLSNGRSNATSAAVEAGYSEATAKQMAYKLLKRPSVQAALDEADRIAAPMVRAHMESLSLDEAKVLTQVAHGAFYDIRALFNEDGSPKAVHELTADQAVAIEGIEIHEKWEGSGENRVYAGRVQKIKLASRTTYLDMLLKNLGLYRRHNIQQAEEAVNALTELMKAMRGSSVPIAKRVDDDVVDG